MAKVKSRGWYVFEDGSRIWFAGLSASEKKIQIMQHGKIVKFEPTN